MPQAVRLARVTRATAGPRRSISACSSRRSRWPRRVDGIINITGPGTSGGSGATEHRLTFHAGLTIFDDHQVLQPHIAAQVPSLNDGSWRVADDGSMELDLETKPNVFWHDGTPLKADDFVFGTRSRATAIGWPIRPPIGTRQLTEVVAPDQSTLIVRFPKPYVGANLGRQHARSAGATFSRTCTTRATSRTCRTAATGPPISSALDPSRSGQWVRVATLEGLAFDQYFLGRPKSDRIIIHYYGDANTMIAALFAGDLDVLPAGAQLDTRPLSTIRQRWGTTGGTVIPIPKGTRNFIPQLRDTTQPWASDLRVRQAIAYALDKQLIVDTLQDGQTIPAYTSITPAFPAFQTVEQRAPRSTSTTWRSPSACWPTQAGPRVPTALSECRRAAVRVRYHVLQPAEERAGGGGGRRAVHRVRHAFEPHAVSSGRGKRDRDPAHLQGLADLARLELLERAGGLQFRVHRHRGEPLARQQLRAAGATPTTIGTTKSSA